MRRKEKEITGRQDIEAVIRNARVCRLAMVDGAAPYLVPLCFGYAQNTLFFHCAKEGRKLDVLKRNNRVCFEFDAVTEVRPGKKACDWGIAYQSVVGFGQAFFIEDRDAKRKALDVIMAQYATGSFDYTDAAVDGITVIRVDIAGMTGKEST